MPRGRPEIPIETRFWSRVNKTETCWEWTGFLITDGYGVVWYKRRNTRAHRLSWLLSNGEIPQGLQVCHHCDNRKCVRPTHLFLGTAKENAEDAVSKGRIKKPLAKLNEESVEKIRALYADSTQTCREIALEFCVSLACVNDILSGRTWGCRRSRKETRKTSSLLRGARHPMAKLSLEQTLEIKARFKKPTRKGCPKFTSHNGALAAEFGVTRNYLYALCRGVSWRHS